MMSLKYGTTTIKDVYYNGVKLSKIIYNGTTVYSSGTQITMPQVSFSIVDADRSGYVQPDIIIYNPNDFTVTCHIVKFAFGSINDQVDYTDGITIVGGEGGDVNKIASKKKGYNLKSSAIYESNELAVPYGGYLEMYFTAPDGTQTPNLVLKHDDWNSTSTSRD
jgi:hypothetical protein